MTIRVLKLGTQFYFVLKRFAYRRPAVHFVSRAGPKLHVGVGLFQPRSQTNDLGVDIFTIYFLIVVVGTRILVSAFMVDDAWFIADFMHANQRTEV